MDHQGVNELDFPLWLLECYIHGTFFLFLAVYLLLHDEVLDNDDDDEVEEKRLIDITDKEVNGEEEESQPPLALFDDDVHRRSSCEDPAADNNIMIGQEEEEDKGEKKKLRSRGGRQLNGRHRRRRHGKEEVNTNNTKQQLLSFSGLFSQGIFTTNMLMDQDLQILDLLWMEGEGLDLVDDDYHNYWLGVFGSSLGFRLFKGDRRPVVSLYDEFYINNNGNRNINTMMPISIVQLAAWALSSCCKSGNSSSEHASPPVANDHNNNYPPPRGTLESVIGCLLESLDILALCIPNSISVTVVDFLLDDILHKATARSSSSRMMMKGEDRLSMARRIREDLVILRVFEVDDNGRVPSVRGMISRNLETAVEIRSSHHNEKNGVTTTATVDGYTSLHLVSFCIRLQYYDGAMKLIRCPHLAHDRLRKLGIGRAVESWFRDVEILNRTMKQQHIVSFGFPNNNNNSSKNWRLQCYNCMAFSLLCVLSSKNNTCSNGRSNCLDEGDDGDGHDGDDSVPTIKALHRLATYLLQLGERSRTTFDCFDLLYNIIPQRIKRACLDVCESFQRLGDVSMKLANNRNRAYQCREAQSILQREPTVRTLHTVVVKALGPAFFTLHPDSRRDDVGVVLALDELRQQVELVAMLCNYLAETVQARVPTRGAAPQQTRAASSLVEELLSIANGFRRTTLGNGF